MSAANSHSSSGERRTANSKQPGRPGSQGWNPQRQPSGVGGEGRDGEGIEIGIEDGGRNEGEAAQYWRVRTF